ncbi:glycosyltransferase [Rothia sp. LK2588]|uniref:glycosyltransferase n=1 Tax=Rothia sp. LK2588 TaxID=3114369 RepID=UPI0034CF4AEE
MHPDEYRSPLILEQQKLNEFVSDPPALKSKYEGLIARDKANRNKLKELDKLKMQLIQQQKELRELREQEQDLTRRLGSAVASVEAYRELTKRLKDDLSRLRGSKALRASRALQSVAKKAKDSRQHVSNLLHHGDIASVQEPIKEENSSSLSKEGGLPAAYKVPTITPVISQSSASSHLSAATANKPVKPAVKKLSQLSTDELIEIFEATPNAQTLHNVINRMWYGLGEIVRPAQLIEQHPELYSKLNKNQQTLADMIVGEYRFLLSEAPIPTRSRGVAYTSEPNRVMYCVHSTPVFNSNGYSTRTRGIAMGLASVHADIVVVGRAGYPWDTKADVAKPVKMHRYVSELDGVQYSHLPGESLNTTPIDRYILQAADAFVREARLLRPSIIQSASNYKTALPALIAARRLGVPFVYEVRGLWEVTQASQHKVPAEWMATERFQQIATAEALVAQEADVVLAITRQVAEELVNRGVDPEKIQLAPNAVDTHEFLPLPTDMEYAAKRKIRTDVPVIGFAGSMVAYEGLDLLLRASKVLNDRNVEHQVVLAGSGTEMERLKALRDELKLNHVHFLGRLPIHEIPRLLSTFSIMPCPRTSLPVTELVSPLKPLESFSSGKAVVLSDVAPHIDLSGEGKRALLFKAGDVDDLAHQLELLIKNEKLSVDLGRAARLWTVDERTWSALGSTIVAAHRTAEKNYAASVNESAQRALSDLTVGLIADEFTSSTLAASFSVVPLGKSQWHEQLISEKLDFIFIESAWKGNKGEWTRGVGDYGPEENSDIFELIDRARELKIPTIFWNKEDPVHFNRFQKTAVRCDHIFTTDANMVGSYLSNPLCESKTASTLPFYAQPRIHNPLEGALPYEDSVAYAGTYYGDRYKERSKQLRNLLTTARPYKLAIYDRQLAVENSPYHFPAEFQQDIKGVLPYNQIIDSYKAHLAQINVNSVTDSPSMFSRRVVEIAASGGLVLSGPGRGISETFGSAIPATNDSATWRALLHDWKNNPVSRVQEAWLQLRTVYRAHTIDTALTILARTVGLNVTATQLDPYAVVLKSDASAVVNSLKTQSVQAYGVVIPEGLNNQELLEDLKNADLKVLSSVSDLPNDIWVGELEAPVSRTHFEDLLLPSRFGEWNLVTYQTATNAHIGRPLACKKDYAVGDNIGLIRADRYAQERQLPEDDRAVQLLFPAFAPVEVQPIEAESIESDLSKLATKTILIAGHDLKFANGIIHELHGLAREVLVDEWENHAHHDEKKSLELLNRADIVFCEWGLGNAVWYSKKIQPHQKLYVRVHSQELRRGYLKRIDHENVEKYIFVGELIRKAATVSHGIPAEKTIVIPNAVDVPQLRQPKHPGAEFNIGLVGIVAQPKRLDRALDLLEELHKVDSRYRLYIKGKQPSDYPWMLNRPEEMEFYNQQYKRIDQINRRNPESIVFDGYGSDMSEWYRKIGIALSVSDFESFHFTLSDGAASGAQPVSLAWPGSDLIYPRTWLHSNTHEVATKILTKNYDKTAAAYVERNFASSNVLHEVCKAIL